MTQGFTKLYVNGCSFTVGNTLEDTDTWPYKVAKQMGLQLFNSAKNGNSMESIHRVTVGQLTDFNPKDTLVVIGITWKERFSILFNDLIVNITPADIGVNKQHFGEKISTWRRTGFPREYLEKKDIEKLNEAIRNLEKEPQLSEYNQVMSSFVKYYENLIQYDKKLNSNLSFKHIVEVLALQNFLQVNGYTYLFVEFDNFTTYCSNEKLYKFIDRSKFLNIKPDEYAEFQVNDKTSHPTAQSCTYISDLVYKKLQSI